MVRFQVMTSIFIIKIYIPSQLSSNDIDIDLNLSCDFPIYSSIFHRYPISIDPICHWILGMAIVETTSQCRSCAAIERVCVHIASTSVTSRMSTLRLPRKVKKLDLAMPNTVFKCSIFINNLFKWFIAIIINNHQ